LTESPDPGRTWRGPENALERHSSSGGLGTGLLVTGLAAVALGALAWYYFGPDLRRYIKIERM
jgi:hypothetical protein